MDSQTPTVQTPHIINVPIDVTMCDRGGNLYGYSELSILLDALSYYRNKIKDRSVLFDNAEDMILTIDDIRDHIIDAALARLSESTNLLYTLTHSKANE